MNNETATINTAPLVREPVKTAERSCPFHYRKASGLLLCVNGLELDGETPKPCSHPEFECHFTRIGIIPLPVMEETTTYHLPAVQVLQEVKV